MSESEPFDMPNTEDIEFSHLDENEKEILMNLALVDGKTTSELYAEATTEVNQDADPELGRTAFREHMAKRAGVFLQELAAEAHKRDLMTREMLREAGFEEPGNELG